MTLSDDAKKLQLEVDESVSELRQTLVRTQKELSKAKQRTEELVEATIQACKDATLALGPMKPIKTRNNDRTNKRNNRTRRTCTKKPKTRNSTPKNLFVYGHRKFLINAYTSVLFCSY